MPPQLSRPPQCSQDVVLVHSVECAFCFANLDMMSVPQRETHYEDHFSSMTSDTENMPARDNDPSRSSSSANATASSPWVKNKTKIRPFNKETDGFWYPSHASTPPTSFTPGLIPLIRRGLRKGHDRGNVRRAVLCYDQVVHINREPWDAGWGCGYRNFLMACGALMNQKQQPLYFPLLDSPISPSIRNLQVWIEAAWREGFDKEGSKELKKLINTTKWIGTAAFNIRVFNSVHLVDFDLKNHREGVDRMIKWVVDYFTPKQTIDKPTTVFESLTNSPVTSTNKMPLILQHNGHSRTIVGYEVDGRGIINLLTFDPAHRPSAELRAKALAEFAGSHSPDSHISSREDSTASSPGSSYLKRKRSTDVQLLRKEKSPRIGEDGHSKPPSKETSTNATSHAKQGSSKNTPKDGLDLYSILKKFRLDPKSLSKNKEYQILYFPMTAPLTDREKMERKAKVTSIKIS
ncbi:hypothetical protein BYT27DRAFT_7236821 [Phlegmacium glaucopus]|nr:hypothetical protein BYT27DRAFT_7236821 [Phlegmacium glaucopus]